MTTLYLIIIGLVSGIFLGVIIDFFKKPKVYKSEDVEANDDVIVEIKTQKPINGIVKRYNKFGKLVNEFTCVNGKINGTAIGYYDSGKIKASVMMVNNKKSGTESHYYESGVIEKEKPYIDDKLEGTEKQYDEFGFLAFTMVWKNDRSADMIYERCEL